MKYGCILMLFLAACNSSSFSSEKPKGEFAFLLKHANRLPSEVGFLTNHIVERRIANLLKSDFQKFMLQTAIETPIEVDQINWQIRSVYRVDSLSNQASAVVWIDVRQDAIWVAFHQADTLKVISDLPSKPLPVGFYKGYKI